MQTFDCTFAWRVVSPLRINEENRDCRLGRGVGENLKIKLAQANIPPLKIRKPERLEKEPILNRGGGAVQGMASSGRFAFSPGSGADADRTVLEDSREFGTPHAK